MSDFSDAEDRYLVQSALQFELINSPVSWSDICMRMPRWKGQKNKLKYRLKALKARFGSKLSAFPARYLQQSPVTRQPPRSNRIAAPDGTSCRLPEELDALLDSSNRVVVELSRANCLEIVHDMFKHVTTADVRQDAGRMELNVGEISMRGVNQLMNVCLLKTDDVFLDVGAGIGNVVVQVALQARVKALVGIEVRPHVVAIGQAAITSQLSRYPQLERLRLLHADVRDPDLSQVVAIKSTSVLYSFNEVFEADANLKLETLCCQLLQLRLVIVSTRFCPRHAFRKSCPNRFCRQWLCREEVPIEVTFKSKPVSFAVYERRRQQKDDNELQGVVDQI